MMARNLREHSSVFDRFLFQNPVMIDYMFHVKIETTKKIENMYYLQLTCVVQ